MSAISRDGRLRGILQGPILASGAVAGSREARYGLDDAVENVYGHVQDAMYRACCESCGSVQAMPSLMTALRRDARIRPVLHFKSDEEADAAYGDVFEENGQIRPPE